MASDWLKRPEGSWIPRDQEVKAEENVEFSQAGHTDDGKEGIVYKVLRCLKSGSANVPVVRT